MAPRSWFHGDANGLRSYKASRAADYTHANGDLDSRRDDVACPKTVTRRRLESIRCILGKRAPMVAAVFLLFVVAVLSDLRGVAYREILFT